MRCEVGVPMPDRVAVWLGPKWRTRLVVLGFLVVVLFVVALLTL